MRNEERTHSSHQALASLAKRQHGVVSIRQLERLGYARSTVSRDARAGRLHRLHRGVYAVGHSRLTWHSRCLAAVLANAPAVASHFSAAWLWGLLRNCPSGAFHLTATTRRHAKSGFELHFARLAEEDRGIVDGIPVTAVAKTQLDLAAVLSSSRVERLLERSEELGLLDLTKLEALLARAGRHPGRVPLERALALYRPDPAFSRSDIERHLRALAIEAGLPAPSLNFNVAGFELDAYWEDERFAVELDVSETHGTRAAFERDRRRQEDLKLIGIEMIRVTGPRLGREPRATIERIGALLDRRRKELGRSA